jgi:phosphoribosylglycinamide formyltransferase-1
MANVAVFISGSASLLPGLYAIANEKPGMDIVAVIADRECTGLNVATMFGYETILSKKCDDALLEYLNDRMIDLIVLAGYLRVIPPSFIEKFKGKIINIHPALLPKYGGKGFYGDVVHQAVLNNKETESGLTIHEVTKDVDGGPIVFQIKCPVYLEDTVDTLRDRVRVMEKEWYPKIAYDYLMKNFGKQESA